MARPLTTGEISVAAGLPARLRLSAADLPLEHHSGHEIVLGRLETSVQDALRRHVGKGAVVYDVGANVGFFSLLAARLAGPGGRVYAFEPLPSNASSVRSHAALNGFDTIEVLELALSDTAGEERLSVPEDASWSYCEHRDPGRRVARKVTVRKDTVDRLLGSGRLPPPDVVKVDVEGAEVEVVAGMERMLRQHRVALICELHGTNAAFVERMEALDYRVVNLDGPEAPTQAGPHIHVLALSQ